MALTTVPVELANLDGAVTVNESSADADFRIESNGDTHRLFIDGGNDRLLIGTTASVAMSGVTPSTFLEGTAYASSTLGMAINSNAANDSPLLMIGKSRGTSLGSNTIVQNGDRLFSLRVHGSDGTNQEQAALIEAHVDAAPGANEIPGRLSFWTTNDGSQYATEKMRIDNAGKVGIGVTPSASWDANIDCLQVGEQSSIWAGDTDYTDATWIGTNVYQTGGTTKYLTTGVASVYGQQGGNHYWYGYSSGSADATVSGNEVMKIDTAGHVTKPLQPAFCVLPSSNQDNIAVTSAVTVVFGTERFDLGSNFASNTFTAPVTGKYQFNAVIRFDNADSAALFYQLGIVTSNENYTSYIDPDFGQDAAYWTLNVSVLADMDASDTAYVSLFQHSGTQQTDVSVDSWFSGYLVA